MKAFFAILPFLLGSLAGCGGNVSAGSAVAQLAESQSESSLIMDLFRANAEKAIFETGWYPGLSRLDEIKSAAGDFISEVGHFEEMTFELLDYSVEYPPFRATSICKFKYSVKSSSNAHVETTVQLEFPDAAFPNSNADAPVEPRQQFRLQIADAILRQIEAKIRANPAQFRTVVSKEMAHILGVEELAGVSSERAAVSAQASILVQSKIAKMEGRIETLNESLDYFRSTEERRVANAETARLYESSKERLRVSLERVTSLKQALADGSSAQ